MRELLLHYRIFSMVAQERERHGCAWQLVFSLVFFVSTAGATVGFTYGRNGDNLPTSSQTVQLLQSLGATHVRIYDTDPSVLSAFQSSNLQLVVGVLNSELVDIGTSNTSAYTWLTTKVIPFLNSTDIYAIAVGNEVLTGFTNASSFLVPAMSNIYAALVANNLQSSIRVSSPCSMELLSQSYVPSSGEFNMSYPEISLLLNFLSQTSSPYMLNVYPWKAYTLESTAIALDYALFSRSAGVFDSGTDLSYSSLFDAQVDAVYSALARANHSDLTIVVSETGWPTAGDANEVGASLANAQTYNANLVQRLANKTGTPAHPGIEIDTFLYEIYNEDLNVGPSSQRNFGMFNVDGTPFYTLNLNGSTGSSATPVSANYTTFQRTWCIAKQGVSEDVLQSSIDFSCGVGNVSCASIQANGTCFLPDTRYSHASWAMNMFYVNSINGASACNYQGAATQTTKDPSYGSCVYPASTSTPVSGGDSLKLRFSSTHLLYQLFFLLLAMNWR